MAKIRYSDEFICPKCGSHTALVCRIDGTHQAHCMICDVYYDVEIAKTTNADRIRAMTDEELARWLCVCVSWQIANYVHDEQVHTEEGWLDWLKGDISDDG